MFNIKINNFFLNFIRIRYGTSITDPSNEIKNNGQPKKAMILSNSQFSSSSALRD